MSAQAQPNAGSIVDILRTELHRDEGGNSLEILWTIFRIGVTTWVNSPSPTKSSLSEAQYRKKAEEQGIAAIVIALKEAGVFGVELTALP